MTSRPDGPAGRLPDFFIVGHHKSGTTALYEMLRRHPQIFMPAVKEPKFFATDLPARLEPDGARGLPQTMAEYTALFAPAGADQLAGEASPSYLRSEAAAGEIAAVRPDAKLIAILREPASFLRSLHLQMVQSHVESELDLRRALAAEEVTRTGVTRRRYSDHVRYVDQLRRYEDRFPRDQFLVLIYDDFRADNEATLRRVLGFLGVDDGLGLETIDTNRTVRVRNAQLDRVVHAVSVGSGPLSGAVKGAVKAVTPHALRRRALQATQERLIYASPEPADEELLGELRRRFKPEVERLSDHLERDMVALWGYDRLD